MFKHQPTLVDPFGNLGPVKPLDAGKRPFLDQEAINEFFNKKEQFHWLITLCDWFITGSHVAERVRWRLWERSYYNGHYPTLGLLYAYLYLPGVYIHELAHYLTGLFVGSWIGRYPIEFSIYHTDSGMGGSVQPQYENRPLSIACRSGHRLLSLQAPTLVWLLLLGGSFAFPFPCNGVSFAWVLLFAAPQSWSDTRSVHGSMVNLLHSIPETFPLRTKEKSLPLWPRIKALCGLTYRVLGWPAFYLKLVLTGLFFLCVPLVKPPTNSIQFSYNLEAISFLNEVGATPARPGKEYRQVMARIFELRYQRGERTLQEFYFFWLLLPKLSYLLAQIAGWLVITGLAIVFAGRGNYFLLGYWALYGHFIAGRPGATWSIWRTIQVISRYLRRERYQAEIDRLITEVTDKSLVRSGHSI